MRQEARGRRQEGELSRRDALKALGAAAALPVLNQQTVQAIMADAGPERWQQPAAPRGTPSDPDLLRPKIWWNKVLTGQELATLSALCDVIIPADLTSPSASQVGVPDFINEWVSAPYDAHREALGQVRDGLRWLEAESQRRFAKPFPRLTEPETGQLCDEICYEPNVTPANRAAARFFDLIRDLCATGFYTTREGMKDLGYVGNIPLQRFDGPPPEVLRHLGLEGGAR